MSKFIVFEGVDKSGKTTQIMRAEEWLKELGYNVIRLVEPGYTKLGFELRQLLKTNSIPCCKEAQKYIFMAARAQLITEELKPALVDNNDKKTVVLCDRYALSTLCYQEMPSVLESDLAKDGFPPNPDYLRYQCYERYRNEFAEFCAKLEFITGTETIMGGGGSWQVEKIRMPDLNIVFDLDFETWKKRSLASGETPDRFESQEEYIKQVIENYQYSCKYTDQLELNEGNRVIYHTFGRCVKIDATDPKDIVMFNVRQVILNTLNH